MANEPKPFMIRGDRLLLALNVLEIGRWPIENWRAHPEWFDKDNTLGLDVERTQRWLTESFGHPGLLRFSDVLCRKLYPFLAANPVGIANAEFSIDAIAERFLSPDCYRPSGWAEDPPRLRAFLMRFASGELTEENFQHAPSEFAPAW